jgi:cell division protein FtsX
MLLWLTSCSSTRICSAARRRDPKSPRRDVGATRGAITRLHCAEALVIAALAATVGVLVTSAAWWLLKSRAAGLAGIGEVSALGWLAWLLPQSR